MSFALPKVNNSEFTPTPPGTYTMRLKTMEDGIAGNPEFGGGERVKWVFEIQEVRYSDDEDAEDYVGEEFWAFTSKSLGKKATMRGWVEALLARELDETDNLSTSDIIGKRAVATVTSYRKANGEMGTKISELTPIKKGRKQPKPEDVDQEDLFD